ncbi:hypothetical protein CYMTET_3749 [Cymbomonas tetramitiformis]|uniref:Uncharacterized protein n=1 Tax=Cymbomonas tetramitiformis TaxID=36881 RepID=A0AAE0H4G4_9CHLO|nr:hypothetical protein CYMTET_3749 [Cymbomonas tetramitiformis]
MGTKDSTFSGNEKNRNALWTSILKTGQQAFEAKEAGNDVLFNLADATKEANPIFNGILFSTLTSLTTLHSPARRWVESSGGVSPKDEKRALLEVVFQNLFASPYNTQCPKGTAY